MAAQTQGEGHMTTVAAEWSDSASVAPRLTGHHLGRGRQKCYQTLLLRLHSKYNREDANATGIDVSWFYSIQDYGTH